MKHLVTLSLTGLALSAPVFAQAPIDALLKQLDTAGAGFKNAQAEVRYDNYTRVVRDHTIQTGSLYIERSGNSSQMGAIFYDLGPDGKPVKAPSKILSYDNATLQIYSPSTSVPQVDVFKAGDNQAKYEGFLTLGFGGSGAALANAWTITDQGPETLSDGAQQIKTEKLDLVGKDPGVRNTFTHVTIWIDPTRDISLKQIFFAPNGDSRTAIYTNIRLNARIDKHPYAISSKAPHITH